MAAGDGQGIGLLIVIIILGIGAALVLFFLLRRSIAPKRAESLLNLISQNKTQPVIKAAKQMIAKESRNCDAHYLLGLAYIAENKPELALIEFRTVNEIGNFDGVVKEVPFREKIAELYLNFNQPEEALKEYLLLAKRDPSNSDYYLKIGRLFEARDRSGKAAAYYKKAAEINPRNSEARTRLGILLYRGKRPVEAREELDAVVRYHADNCEAWYYIGRILRESGDCIAAVSALEKAGRDAVYKVRSLIERAGCFITLENTERAIAELERAAKLADESSSEGLHARYFLAHCYEKTRRIELAVPQWERIHAQKRDFKDVAEKLTKYQDLRVDDRVKDYLTMTQEKFTELCHKLTETMELTVRDVQPIEGGCEVIAVEQTSKWRNVRAMPKLIRYMRFAEVMDEPDVRDVQQAMKKQSITSALIVSSSGFTRAATEYAQSRPIDLHGQDRLQALLQKLPL